MIEDAVRSKLWRFRLGGAARGSINYELIEDALSQSRGTRAFRLAAANYLGARAVAGLGSVPELVEEVKAEAKLSAPTLGLMALFGGAVDAGGSSGRSWRDIGRSSCPHSSPPRYSSVEESNGGGGGGDGEVQRCLAG